MKKKRYDSRKLVPVAVIKAAAAGDPLAVQMVLNHYQGYIIWLSTRTMYDETGKAHYVVDETLKSRLENKLIHKILEFQVREHRER